LGIKHPIIQGGMAWVGNANLAAAVSNAGGLGLIAAASDSAEIVKEQIKKCKTLTDKPFGVNIMMMSPFVSEIVQLCIDERVSVVTTGAGNPSQYIPPLKAAGIKVIPVVPSVALALRMEKAGADAIVCEGQEAGGHIGELTTMALVPMVCDALKIPVVAAGGIADGRGLAASIMLGASGVQVGTRFLVANECNIHQTYKDLVIGAKDTETIVTGRFTGHPVRTLKSKFSRELITLEKEGISLEQFEKMGAGSLKNAVVSGDIEKGSFMCGQIAGMIDKPQSAFEIVEDIINSANHILRNFEKLRGIEIE